MFHPPGPDRRHVAGPDGQQSLLTGRRRQVTPNLRCHAPARTDAQVHSRSWLWVRVRGHIDRPRRADLDSEGENERSRFGRRRASRIRALARLVWRGRHLITGNDNRVPRVLVRDAAQLLSDEDGAVDSHAPTAVIPRHAWRRAAVGLLMALRHRCAARVAPHFAKQRGVLAYRQQQHDRKDRSSKHGILGTPKGKTWARRVSVDERRSRCFWRVIRSAPRDLRNFADRAENPPADPLPRFVPERTGCGAWHRSC